jgi:hypothetical protein
MSCGRYNSKMSHPHCIFVDIVVLLTDTYTYCLCGRYIFIICVKTQKKILKCLFKTDTILHQNTCYYSIWKTFFF